MERNQSTKKGKVNPSESNKRKMVSPNEPIPKKVCKVVKHCALCKKHGGAHAMHNTSDCHKYDKDGKLKKGFGKGQHGSTALDKKLLVHLLSFLQRLQNLRRQTRSSRRAPRSASVSVAVTVVTLTPLEGAGPVVHGGTTVVSL